MSAVVLRLAGSFMDSQGNPYSTSWSVLGGLFFWCFFSGLYSAGIFSCLQSAMPGVGQVLGTSCRQ